MQGTSRFNNLPYLFVKDGMVVEVSKEFSELTEYSEESLIQYPISNLFIKLRATQNLEDYLNALHSETECFIFTKSLEVREVLIIFKKIDKDNIIIFAEKENSRLGTKFQLAEAMCNQNMAGVGIFCVSPRIVLLKANQTYLNFFTEPCNKKENVFGKCIEEFVAGWKGSNSEILWNNILKTGKAFYSEEYEYKWPGIGSKYYKASLIPIFEGDKIKYVIESTTEITKEILYRKRIDELAETIRLQNKMIVNAEKAQMEELTKALKLKNEFISTITHEFKTPLAVIIAAIQTINTLYYKELPEKVKKHIQIIRTNAYRQLRLVNNLLDLAKYNEAHLKIVKQNLDIVYITKFMTESVQPFANQKNIAINFSSDKQKFIIALDEQKYERIILNLLSNAIKFTNNGKSIYIHLSFTDKSVNISIKDEGVGIPKNKHKAIFERFEQVNSIRTNKGEGTGLGLTLVKSLAVAMGGSITLKSQINQGTEFIVTLPVTKLKNKTSTNINSFDKGSRILDTIAIEFSDIYI